MRWIERINPDELSDYARYLHSNLISKKTNAKVMNNLIKELTLHSLPKTNIHQSQQHDSSLDLLNTRVLKVFALNTPTNAQVAREFLSKLPRPISAPGAENNAAAAKSQTKPLIRVFGAPLRPMRTQ